VSEFEKLVFNDSYEEFLIQIQAYNPGSKFKTIQEVTAANPKANSLPANKFEIVESDITNKSSHKIAITYITGALALVEIIGEYMLLAVIDQFKNEPDELKETFLLKMQDGLSITSYFEQRITTVD
jgi:hypothetical protein